MMANQKALLNLNLIPFRVDEAAARPAPSTPRPTVAHCLDKLKRQTRLDEGLRALGNAGTANRQADLRELSITP